jgi:tetratricopeptide (TPR) repeat protein
MKRIIVVVVLFVPMLMMAQKEIKPSLPKAEKALKDKKLDEAKAIIDMTVSDPATMTDKKGEPTKNAAKAWYLKGVIYASIDTSSNEKVKALVADPFPIAMEAFKKSEEIDKGKSGYFVTDASGLPILNENVKANLANAYYMKAAKEFQDTKDYAKAFQYVSQTIEMFPDTVFLNPAGVFFAPQAKEYDKSIEWLNMYVQKGGTSSDAYVMLFSIYRDNKKDNDMALKMIKEARAKFPAHPDFPKYELNLYITNKQYDVAKAMVEGDIKANPNDKDALYLLGELNKELKNVDAAKEAFEKALQVDPNYFDALASLTDLYWLDAKVIKDTMGRLGITKDDMAKKQVLDKQYLAKLKVYLPYIIKCEKLQPDNVNILYQLLNVYSELDDQPNVATVKKKLKGLGEDVD